MAETISDSDSDVDVPGPIKPPPKRRRIIDPSAVCTVPIYSNKVSSSLQLKPFVFKHASSAGEDADELDLWDQPQSLPRSKEPAVSIELSDTEEDEQEKEDCPNIFKSPSPPPPPKPSRHTKRPNRQIREINRKLNALDSLLYPEDESKAAPDHSSATLTQDDDIIVVTDQCATLPSVEESREISLKFRCRTDLYKIPVQSTAPLSMAVDQLAVKLQVPPARILLLRKDAELPGDCSVNELGLGIADIIDCVVIAEADKEETGGEVITVRLQGKDKGSTQDYSIHKQAPLGSVLSQYVSLMAAGSRPKVCFLFDGKKVTYSQTPSQLEMEDGDVIEVWT